jgi:predicted porin
MNKKLLTVAVAAILAAPTAVLADVTVYGRLHMSADYTDSTSTPTRPGSKTNLGVSSNSSRLGFKGSEDVGGGLKTVWQMESTIDVDGDSASSLANRNTYLGLAGGFGTFLMGRHDTPFKMFSRSLDPFTDTIADTRQLLGQSGAFDGGVGFDLRAPNVIAYITPDFSGFNAVLAYVTGAAKNTQGADNNKLGAFSFNTTYKNGPIYAGFAYENHSKNIVGTTGRNNPSAWRLGGSYAFGPAKIGAMYEQLSDVDSSTANLKRSGSTLFGTYTFGMETVKLAYTQVGKWKNNAGSLSNSQASLVALGVDHQLSKRTTAYAQYTGLNNKSSANYSLGGGGGYGDPIATTAFGRDPGAFSLGLTHNF